MDPKLDPSKGKIVPRPQTRIFLYWPAEEIQVWEVFKKAMDRDASSASRQVREWIKQWYRGHAPGNPQTPLTLFQIEAHKHQWIQKEGGGASWIECKTCYQHKLE